MMSSNRYIDPLVSVVIPTRGRAQLVARAVASALEQTERNIEVIVVIDGPDHATEATLDRIANEEPPGTRLVKVTLEQSVGGAEARNVGIRVARGRWVALLDDDDEWLPNKLQAQVDAAEAAEAAGELESVVACKYLVRSPHSHDVVRPRRLPRENEAASDFMFDYLCYFQTSTLFASKALFLRVPFQKDLACFHDIDWFLRATTSGSARLVVVPEPLAIYHAPDERVTITSKLGWKGRLSWGRANRHRMSLRGYSRFISGSCAGRAAQDKAGLKGLGTLLRECVFQGSPSPANVALILCTFLVTPEMRRRIRDAFFLQEHKKPSMRFNTAHD
jgi:glycosyltransferase involved in cell wall biosynthesis